MSNGVTIKKGYNYASHTEQCYGTKLIMPKKIIINTFPNTTKTVSQLLQAACKLLQESPERQQFNSYIDNKIKEITTIKKQKALVNETYTSINVCNTTLNTVEESSAIKPLQMAMVTIHTWKILALVDTGASSSLMHCTLANKIMQAMNPNEFTYKLTDMNLKCASGSVSSAISGLLTISVTITDCYNNTRLNNIQFMVSKALGDWILIIGNNVLLDDNISTHIYNGGISINGTHITLFKVTKDQLGIIEKETVIEPNCTRSVNVIFPFMRPCNVNNNQVHAIITQNMQDTIAIQSQNPFTIGTNNITMYNKADTVATLHTGQCIAQAHPVLNQRTKHMTATAYVTVPFFATNLEQFQHHDTIVVAEDDMVLKDDLEYNFEINEEGAGSKSTIDTRPLTYEDGDFSACTKQEKQQLCAMLKDFSAVYAANKMDIGRTNYVKHKIEINPHKVIKSQKQRYMAGKKLQYAQESIKLWESMGIVEEYEFPKFVSNLVMVQRHTNEYAKDTTKAGKYRNSQQSTNEVQYRLTVDFTDLNNLILHTYSPNTILPEAIIQKLINKKITSMDISLAYYTIELDEKSKAWTGFYLGNHKKYVFKRLPMGLSNAPAEFCNFMKLVFSPEIFNKNVALLDSTEQALLNNIKSYDDVVCYYFDDVWVFSNPNNINLHITCLKLVMMAFRQAGVKISPKKCKYYTEEFSVLKLQMNSRLNTLEMDILKSNAILAWDKPSSVAEASSRLQALNYFSKFLPQMRLIATPIFLMVRSGKFYWDNMCQQAWDMLKALVILNVKLNVPAPNEQLIIFTDAAKSSCSQILFKRQENSKLAVVATNSKIFAYHDYMRAPHFKEAASLALAFKVFLPYLSATTVPPVIFTDAKNLISLARSRERSIFASNMLTYLAKMTRIFQFNIYHVASPVNALADICSRTYPDSKYINKEYKISQEFITQTPQIDKFATNSNVLWHFLTEQVAPSPNDEGNKLKSRIKKLDAHLQLYDGLLPEQCFTSAMIMVKELIRNVSADTMKNYPSTQLFNTELTTQKKQAIQLALKTGVQAITDIAFGQHTDKLIKTKITNSLLDNAKKIIAKEIPINQSHSNEVHTIKALKSAPLHNHDIMTFQEESPIKEKNEGLSLKICVEQLLDTIKPEQTHINTVQFANFTPEDNDPKVQIICTGKYQPSATFENDAGLDLPVQETVIIQAQQYAKINAKVKINIPQGYCGILYKKSSAAKLQFTIHHGVIDSGYLGFIYYVCYNNTNTNIMLTEGKAYVQICIHKIHKLNVIKVDEFDIVTDRNECAFGEGTKFKLEQVNAQQALKACTANWAIASMPIIASNQIQVNQLQIKNENIMHTINQAKRWLQIEANRHKTIWTPHVNATTTDIVDDKVVDIIERTAKADVDYLKNNCLTKEAFVNIVKECETFGQVYKDCQQNGSQEYTLINELLYKVVDAETNKLAIPTVLVASFIAQLHKNAQHNTKTQLKKQFARDFYHPRIDKLINAYTESCITCIVNKWTFQSPSNEKKGRTFMPIRPNQSVSLDTIPSLMNSGPQAYNAILVWYDNYSHFVKAVPIKDRTQNKIYQAIKSIICTSMIPAQIIYDNETGLKAAVLQIKQELPEIEVKSNPPYAPWLNNAEKGVNLIKKTITKLIYNTDDPRNKEEWHLLLPIAITVINNAIIGNVGFSRAELHFNKKNISMFSSMEIVKELEIQLAADVTYSPALNQTPASVTFKKGDLVLIKNDAPPAAGVKKVFSPKNKLRIYKVIEQIQNTSNITVKDVESQEERVVPVVKLTKISPTQYMFARFQNTNFCTKHNILTAKSNKEAEARSDNEDTSSENKKDNKDNPSTPDNQTVKPKRYQTRSVTFQDQQS